MSLKRRQTDRGSYYKEECLEEFLDGKGNDFAMVMKVIIIMRVYNENNK